MKLKNMYVWVLMCIMGLASCQYQDIVDADYTEQKVYMAAAVSGIYQVNDTNDLSGRYRYQLDLESNKMIIPLGVYRSGVNNEGTVKVDIELDNDTINAINEIGKAEDGDKYREIHVIPDEAFEIPSSVTIKDGKEIQNFNVAIDLDYIASQPDKHLGLAFTLKSNQIKVDPLLNTLVLELVTNFIVPTAEFKVLADEANDKKYVFMNHSYYASECTWDFGDGTQRVTTQDTIHHYYNAYGNYQVSMTVSGISHKPVVCQKEVKAWENLSRLIKNPGAPFLRSDVNREKVAYGTLADWTATDNLKVFKDKNDGTYHGGYLKSYRELIDGKRCTDLMFMFSKLALENGKIYQTVTLEKGSYNLSSIVLLMKGENKLDFAVVKGSVMPDADALDQANVLGSLEFDKTPSENPSIAFELEEQTTVTFGFVVNTPTPAKGKTNEVVIESVRLTGFLK